VSTRVPSPHIQRLLRAYRGLKLDIVARTSVVLSRLLRAYRGLKQTLMRVRMGYRHVYYVPIGD